VQTVSLTLAFTLCLSVSVCMSSPQTLYKCHQHSMRRHMTLNFKTMLRESSSIRHHPANLLPVHSMQQTMPTVLCSHVQKNARSLEQHSESSHSELRKNHTGRALLIPRQISASEMHQVGQSRNRKPQP